MQQHKIVEDYLNSVIPNNLTAGGGAELREEIESHIYDKAYFYIEIGFDENTAFEGMKVPYIPLWSDILDCRR